MDTIAGRDGGENKAAEIKNRIDKQAINFYKNGGTEEQWNSLMDSLPNRDVWMQKGETPAGTPEKAAAKPKQQKGKKAGVKAAELRTKPVKGKILTTKSVVNRLKAAGVTDQKVVDQANRVIKKYIEKAVAGQVPVYEAVNLAVGGQSLLKQLMKIPGLRSVPDSTIKQILKDLETQLTANDIEVIKSKKDLASSKQKPEKDFDGETGEPLTDAGREKCAAYEGDHPCKKFMQGEKPAGDGPDTKKTADSQALLNILDPIADEWDKISNKTKDPKLKNAMDYIEKVGLAESMVERSEIIYEKLLKKWNIK